MTNRDINGKAISVEALAGASVTRTDLLGLATAPFSFP